jgi:hypothetical protein
MFNDVWLCVYALLCASMFEDVLLCLRKVSMCEDVLQCVRMCCHVLLCVLCDYTLQCAATFDDVSLCVTTCFYV